MKFVLIEDAKHVLFRSWTSVLSFSAAVAGMLAAAQPDVPLLQNLVSQKTFAAISIVCAVSVPFARILRQERFHDDHAGDKQA